MRSTALPLSSNRPSEEKMKMLAARPYQLELLELAKKKNIIVYLGTGSGKTFIAVMLIQHLRGELGKLEKGRILGGKKAIFLVSSVALVEQQAREIRNTTGLQVGTYSGSDGVDNWEESKWMEEFSKHQVLVFVHEVFRAVISCKFLKFRDLALLVLDECHHAVKSHPYKIIMEMYHKEKDAGSTVPKVLGLTACVVVQTCNVEKFRKQKFLLEKTMDCKVETTEDLKSILQFVTAPKESFEYYSLGVQRAEMDKILELYCAVLLNLDTIMDAEKTKLKKEKSFRQSDIACKDLQKDFKKLKNDVVVNNQAIIESLGVYPMMTKLDHIIEDVKKESRKETNSYYSDTTRVQLFNATVQYLVDLKKICQKIEENETTSSKLEKIGRFASTKFMKLLEIILQEKKSDGYMSLRGIVFVERQSVAVHLAGMLQEVFQEEPEFAELNVDYVHSVGTGLNIKNYQDQNQISSERRRLEHVLDKFRKGDLNILISTSVVEEGLDVQKCNLVIKYDFPLTFRSYVQSKGRARKSPSQYIMMTETNSGKHEKIHREFQEVERISLEECHSMPESMDFLEEDETESYTAPFDPNQPEKSGTVTGSQAIALVYQYISKIPVDRFTRLVPCWRTVEVQGSNQDKLLRGLMQNTASSGYRTICYMPHKTPFADPIEGNIRPSQERAKKSCALEVVRMLYECGELNIRLKPRKRERVLDEEDEDNEDERGRKEGTRRRRHFYSQRLPRPLNLSSTTQGFLYQVKLNLIKELENQRYLPYFPQQDTESLGILVQERIPGVGPLNLYGSSGTLSVNVSFLHKVEISEDELLTARDFHNYAFSQVLKIERIEPTWNSYLLVPLENGELNLDLYMDRSEQMIQSNSVVSPKYKKVAEHYFVEDFIRNKNPESIMDGKKSSCTYIQYFKEKYSLDIQDKTQPLLRISSADKNLFMFKPGGEAIKDKDSEDLSKRTLLVPELLDIAWINRGLWKQIQVIPFVLQRMSSLLHASQLSSNLTGIQYPEDHILNLEITPGQDTGSRKLLEQLMKFDPRMPLKNVNLVEALTLINADDMVNMERMEVLGDVFLKFRTSMFVYYSMLEDETKNKTNVNEGELTMLRSKVVGNKNLFRVASRLNLPNGPVNAVKIESHSSFLPPGYTSPIEQRLVELDDKFPSLITDERRRSTLSVGSLLNYIQYSELTLPDEDLLNLAKRRFLNREATGGVRTRENVLISDKSLADVVEALIGCYLINTGTKNTLQVMARMGLDLTPENNVSDLLQGKMNIRKNLVEFKGEENAFANLRMKQSSALVLYNRLCVSEIEEKIGYRFKEKSFILQAFTHSSYTDNNLTDSYERLEYLGDAVLDYLVSCYIYTKTDADPGRLTDIRSALVCNNMFAGLLVDKGLHGNILYEAPIVRNKIVEYVDFRTEDTAIPHILASKDKVLENLKRINESEPPSVNEVEVPKVLGDVFEALIGAVFVDSGHDLEVVWKVYNRFNPQLDFIIQDPPKNPKKVLFEMFPGVKFGKAELKENHVNVTVTIFCNGKDLKFIGRGNNKRMAEIAASKCALRRMHNRHV